MNDTPNASEMQKALDKLAERTAALSERRAALETFNALIRLAANPARRKARVDRSTARSTRPWPLKPNSRSAKPHST